MASATHHKPRISKGRAFWEDHANQWRQSGLSKIAYCRTHGLSKSTFHNWCRKLQHQRQENQQSQDFLSLGLQQDAPIKSGSIPESSSTATIEIQLPKGIIIKVSSPIDSDALFQVLHVVRQLP